MIDAFDIPGTTKADTKIFYCRGADVQLWEKPRGCGMVMMVTVGSGGGGGAGFQDVAGNARGGGGGGGSGAIARLVIPAICLPDVLWIFVAAGGAGATTVATGGAGANSFISAYQSTGNVNDIVCASGNATVAGGGAAGAASGAAAGGAANGVSSFSRMKISIASVIATVAGTSGAAGGTPTAAGSDATQLGAAGIPLSGGAGGGGCTAAYKLGGQILTNSSFFNSGVILAPSGNEGVAGFNGPLMWGSSGLSFLSAGGSGGNASNTGAGGRGGDGNIGSGGGGGGASVNGFAVGAGGNGGNGLVIISAW